ncbi:MAG: GIY-YIG nuclease family protein [Calothrix sp. MO_192.B10]|nr:GIY-YIG nuclease family protein [Calothrix sp. MO_192.B10]
MNNNYYRTSTYIERDENVTGYIYIMEAEGFHGIFPGKLLKYKRIKIGLSRNPNSRENRLNSTQPPCNINLIDTVYVYNMKDAETHLHQMFQSCNVKLRKSKEWYDFNHFQYISLIREINKVKKNPNWCPLAKQRFFILRLNLKIKLLLALLISLFLGSAFIANQFKSANPPKINPIQQKGNEPFSM